MQIGIVGLGRMGGNIAVRLTRHGHDVVVYDRDTAMVEKTVARAESGRAVVASNLADVVEKLNGPKRIVWSMLPAGTITEETVMALAGLMQKGDIVIDGGNTYYKDDIRRAKMLAEKGIDYIDVGTSGGVWGLDRGYCMMYGGPREAADHIDPILASLAPGIGDIPRTPGRDHADLDPRAEQGYLYCGPAGSGHFVKMVHNGIEYGMMQAFAEGFDVMYRKDSPLLAEDERFSLNMADIAEVWRRGSVVSSWLLDLTAQALAQNGELSEFSGEVSDSGEGRWTIEAAIEESVPVPVMTAALFTRFRSRSGNTFAEKVLSAMRFGFGGHVENKN
ncbi:MULTISPECIES: phosphogluconate dehydrogenase (NAD(+)-dependent, decarboxylating) [Acetobacter]|uniref:6-phosphogluconate dehydrogenase (Decarboxylating) n=2 Tax=Acetobacter TaxID=434 RepID=A0AAN1PG04_9PROT|nr:MULTISPECIES: decarboxylating 6-phosphogluconate dehydrogenase [Acetobacter]ASL41113.1 6-phosphogluconate dehydrogenase (decarboxylating) [Acetobacter oryzifermentans]AXM99562.1 6-phosphogluconate dehydrogenase (decarboxylating) [Acetobacter pomorum]KAA8394174.1 decarboxylating 6-phosphogluconate dehydrogenase [Acetobacter sp. DmW_125127]KAA8396012.1 decarboxylating 6-phosphogluconate dehydrogenase [Acetobacter sp. DmW_125124]KAA8399815.1 decarboxylating 6-phosphogluconate dehydrogenase [Ac